jgi:two-component system response regulator YesN
MHIFKTEVGKTFNECLIDYRIERAKELLKDSRYKIYEVSGKVGYKDVKYFSQIFKKITGMSPSEYIK